MHLFEYQSTSIEYIDEGKGKPVILIHGFAETGNVFTQQIELLKKNCRVIVPNLPGSGNSSLLVADKIGIETYAHCMAALITHLGLHKAVVLGHSMGGYITLALAELYPQFLAGFGLLHATAYADSDEKKQNRQRSIYLMEEHGAFPFLKTIIPGLFSKKTNATKPIIVEQHLTAAKTMDTAACIQYYAAMKDRNDRTQVLKSSKVPVLFILGREDVAAPLNDLMAQSILPQTAYLHILEETAHMGMLEEPILFSNYLQQFIDDMQL
jgi:pimeloyl-ACP methyl ester carboxylesterase